MVKATKNKPVSLRRTLFIRLILFITGTAALVCLGFFILALLPIVDEIAEKEFTNSANRVEADLDALLNPAHALLKMSSEWIGDSAPDLDQPDQFNQHFQPLLKQISQITSVVAGTTSGKGWLLLQLADGVWQNRMTDIERWGDQHLMIVHHPDGKITRKWSQLDYDARNRPWFKAAMKRDPAHTVSWTAPYIFFSTHDPGITASIRRTLNNGEELVLGFDLTLKDLSNYTMKTKVGINGFTLVITDNESLLAMPNLPNGTSESAWLKQVLQPVSSLGIPALNDALQKWHQLDRQTQRILSFQSGSQRWLANIRPYSMGAQKLWVMTMAPAGDFTPNWLPIAMAVTSGLIFLLATAFLIARKQALSIARPLEKLAETSHRIGQLDFQAIAPVKSRIKEIQQLAATQDDMCKTLQQNQSALAEQAERLQHQINALQQAEADLHESNIYNKVLFSESRIPLLVIAPETETVVDCNLAAARIFHLGHQQELLNKQLDEISATTQYDDFDSAESIRGHIKLAQLKGSHLFEWRFAYPDGKSWDAEVHLMDFQFESRSLLQASLLDVTERRATANQINQLAFYDTLTHLPNRRLFLDRLQQALSGTRKEHEGALLIIDLNDFKSLNDTMGHDKGDLLLQQFALRLSACIPEGDTAARLGSDEFVVILKDLSGDTQKAAAVAQNIAEKILAFLNRPFELADQVYHATASIGIALFGNPLDTTEELLKRADLAMNQAKRNDQQSLCFFDPGIQDAVNSRITLETDLRQAIRDENFQLYYQPQVDHAGCIIGAEALIRWPHPTRGMVSPAEFIPAAEQIGLILPIGHWVLENACRQLVLWAEDPILERLTLAVNVSAVQFRKADFVSQTLATLDHTGANPKRLKLELTESMLLHDIEGIISKMTTLKARGVLFSLDDFGTGYSSLSYLKRLPLDQLKIDQSFVRDLLTDPNDAAITNTIIALSHSLGLEVIAEGVETEAQHLFLTSQGCRSFQGYLFGKPGPVEQVLTSQIVTGSFHNKQGAVS
ncbi:MAG: EAL domain-containing protein [Sedimenticola sp.]|nr:EAL domain-containing protein [Sedimenticola sp.]